MEAGISLGVYITRTTIAVAIVHMKRGTEAASKQPGHCPVRDKYEVHPPSQLLRMILYVLRTDACYDRYSTFDWFVSGMTRLPNPQSSEILSCDVLFVVDLGHGVAHLR